MIISRKYAKHIIRIGKAMKSGIVTIDGKRYRIINRTDLQRTDHYLSKSV